MIIKGIGLGFLSLFVGQFIGFILYFAIGLLVEIVAEKMISDVQSLKRFRHLFSYSCIGFGIGILNALLIDFFKINGWIPTIIFIIYLVIFLPHRKDFIFSELCEENKLIYKKLLRKTELTTFISYIIGVYGLWSILITL